MNIDINQKISEFLDGEMEHTEMESLLLKIKCEPELKNKMNRYQTVSHVLKTDDAPVAHECFLDKINQELSQDPHYFLPKKAVKSRGISRWQKTSVAMAATVACFAVFLGQQSEIQNSNGQPLIAQKQAVQIQLQATNTTKNTKHERFKAYLQAHSDDLYTYGSLNVPPFANVASYNQD